VYNAKGNPAMKFKTLLFLTFVIILVLDNGLVQAKGPPDRVKISSPNLPHDVTLDDQALIGPLGMVMLEDVSDEIKAPFGIEGSARIAKAAQEGSYRLPMGAFLITRYYKNGARYIPFDQVIYFEGDGMREDVVLYVGIVNGWSEYDGHWYRPTVQGAGAFQKALNWANPVARYWRWKVERN
jgi:hypothetical protein